MKKIFARKLRKNSTDAELLIWRHLRNRNILGCKFRRQMPIKNYIVDFVSIENKIIIELDGGQHAENSDYDLNRTAILAGLGYEVIRFWNNEVLTNFEGVMEVIIDTIEKKLLLEIRD